MTNTGKASGTQENAFTVQRNRKGLAENPVTLGLVVGQLFGAGHAGEVGLAIEAGCCVSRRGLATCALLGIVPAAAAVVMTGRFGIIYWLAGRAGDACRHA